MRTLAMFHGEEIYMGNYALPFYFQMTADTRMYVNNTILHIVFKMNIYYKSHHEIVKLRVELSLCFKDADKYFRIYYFVLGIFACNL